MARKADPASTSCLINTEPCEPSAQRETTTGRFQSTITQPRSGSLDSSAPAAAISTSWPTDSLDRLGGVHRDRAVPAPGRQERGVAGDRNPKAVTRPPVVVAPGGTGHPRRHRLLIDVE